MAEQSPSSSDRIDTFEDRFATDRFLAGIAAFNHRAAAQEIKEKIHPYTYGDAQSASPIPGLAYVFGWTINAISNIPRQHRVAWHESQAQRIYPQGN